MRRLCNVLFAFVRQDVRESRNGFLPRSDLEHVTFDPQKASSSDDVWGVACMYVYHWREGFRGKGIFLRAYMCVQADAHCTIHHHAAVILLASPAFHSFMSWDACPCTMLL